MFSAWFRAHGARRQRPIRPASQRPRRSLALESLEDRQVPATFWVNSTADVVNPSDGALTLREAILAANARGNLLNSPPGAPDQIHFRIPGVGPHTIQPLTALPTITEAVVINGYTQPLATPNTLPVGFGTSANLRIELNGSLLTKGESGLVLEGRGSTVKGLVINGFAYPDVGDPGSERHIPAGGIVLLGRGGHVVQGNFIGTDVSGLNAKPNQFQGIYVSSSNNSIGGTARAARNLISGNQGFGVHITARDAPGGALHTPAENNRVMGNLIGTNRFGTAALANTGAGVVLSVFARNNVIGGTIPAARNVISGNGGPFTPFGDPGGPYQDWPDAPWAMDGGHGSGVHIANLTSLTFTGHAVPNSILGNYIGTNAAGTAAVPNKQYGVKLVFTNRVTIRDNVISGNGEAGVAVSGTGLTPVHNVVVSNRIGTAANGVNPIPNAGDGVHVSQASRNTIFRNTIAYNRGTGVIVANTTTPTGGPIFVSTGNTISQNSIFSNGQLGIDLPTAPGFAPDGPTANDAQDPDQGPNGMQNYPTIALARPGLLTRVLGTLNSQPNTLYRLEFFVSAAPDPSGFGEGRHYLASILLTTNGSGNASFNEFLPVPTTAGQWITVTATDVVRRNTSEFSRAVRLRNLPTLVKPVLDVPLAKPPFVHPGDPPASSAATSSRAAVRALPPSGGGTEARDALLTLVSTSGKRESDLWKLDLGQDLFEDLVKARV